MCAEVYRGTKFRTIFVAKTASADPRLAELILWCRRLAETGVIAAAMGNLSFRTMDGFMITPTGTDPATITTEQFVEVISVNVAKCEITARGLREPSSESMTHATVYAARPDVNAAFHGHSAEVLAMADKLGLTVTEKVQPYGTPELAAEIQKVVFRSDFFVMRNHGFVSLGKTMEDAGTRLLEVLRQTASRSKLCL